MPGTATLTSSPGYPGGVAAQLVVSRYTPTPEGQDPDEDFTNSQVVPNVECLGVQISEGANPRVARLRYRMGTQVNPAWPDRVEDIMGLGVKPSPYLLSIDDRIVVVKVDPDGPDKGSGIDTTILFDGLCQVPQMDVSGDTEAVTFQAVGIETRLWESVVGGATYRDGPKFEDMKDTVTARPTRFNPDGKPNMVARTYWSEIKDDDEDDGGDPDDPDDPPPPPADPAKQYPVFLDTPEDGYREAKYFELWTLPAAVRYLLTMHNKAEKYVKNPNYSTLSAILDSFEVVDGKEYDPADPTTFTEKVITVEDYDATGDPWPVAIEKLIQPYGFAFKFVLEDDEDGNPTTKMVFYRTDANDDIAPKFVYLANAGQDYNPTASNAAAMTCSQKADGVYNEVVLDTQLVRREVSLVLAPGFTIDADDAADAAVKTFTIGDPDFLTGDNFVAYRYFIFDEDGVGHWDFKGAATVDEATSLDDVFGAPVPDPIDPALPPTPKYAKRPRKPISPLFTRSQVDGDRLKAQLHVSNDFTGKSPAVWDRTGKWQLVADGTWELLPHRLGIRFVVDNPDRLNIGKPADPAIHVSDGAGLLRLVQCLAAPTGTIGAPTGNRLRCYFRLTCVVESDEVIDAKAEWRFASTVQRRISRRIDTSDRFVKHVVDESSALNTTGAEILDQDDTDDAKAYAQAMRMAHESAPIEGTVTISRFTMAYEIGDPIKGVYGRGVSFRVNQGAPQGEAAVYPTVSSISYEFGESERTTLHLTTRQYEPPPERRR